MDNKTVSDNYGRRLGIDQRIFSYDDYGPDRRSGYDRRSGLDRRCKQRKEVLYNMLAG